MTALITRPVFSSTYWAIGSAPSSTFWVSWEGVNTQMMGFSAVPSAGGASVGSGVGASVGCWGASVASAGACVGSGVALEQPANTVAATTSSANTKYRIRDLRILLLLIEVT